MIKKILIILIIFPVSFFIFSACSKKEALKNGYYTAQVKEYEHGWKEFVTICVSNNKISSVEYNAKNSSGFIKSWDIDYMRTMSPLQGTYPNQYTRTYAAMLLENQNAENIDAISGASSSWNSFKQLSAAVIEKAKQGDSTVAIVDIKK